MNYNKLLLSIPALIEALNKKSHKLTYLLTGTLVVIGGLVLMRVYVYQRKRQEKGRIKSMYESSGKISQREVRLNLISKGIKDPNMLGSEWFLHNALDGYMCNLNLVGQDCECCLMCRFYHFVCKCRGDTPITSS